MIGCSNGLVLAAHNFVGQILAVGRSCLCCMYCNVRNQYKLSGSGDNPADYRSIDYCSYLRDCYELLVLSNWYE